MAVLRNPRVSKLIAGCLSEDWLNPRDEASRSVDTASESDDGIPTL